VCFQLVEPALLVVGAVLGGGHVDDAVGDETATLESFATF
jgi:hypothetical protein